jgi:gas vesicle protein
MEQRMAEVLHSPMTEEALAPSINRWVSRLTPILQGMVDPICDRYEVPRKEMALNLIANGGTRVAFSANEMLNFSFMGTLLGLIVSVIVGLLCGGGGLALIAAGPLGFLAGAVIGALVSLFGWSTISKQLMKVNLPMRLRILNSEKRLASETTRQKLREAINKELYSDSGAFVTQVTKGFSTSFRKHLQSIAQAAEIPIE